MNNLAIPNTLANEVTPKVADVDSNFTAVLNKVNEIVAFLNGILGSVFTATCTGFAVIQTPSVYYAVSGNIVILFFPIVSSASNSVDLIFTGLPAGIIPTRNQVCMVTGLQDNGVYANGVATVNPDGKIRFFQYTPSQTGFNATNVFTASGVKGVNQCIITYLLN